MSKQKSSYTPGAWTYWKTTVPAGSGRVTRYDIGQVNGHKDFAIATVYNDPSGKANARLIAQAPMMLLVCEMICSPMCEHDDASKIAAKIIDAVKEKE